MDTTEERGKVGDCENGGGGGCLYVHSVNNYVSE